MKGTSPLTSRIPPAHIGHAADNCYMAE